MSPEDRVAQWVIDQKCDVKTIETREIKFDLVSSLPNIYKLVEEITEYQRKYVAEYIRKLQS